MRQVSIQSDSCIKYFNIIKMPEGTMNRGKQPQEYTAVRHALVVMISLLTQMWVLSHSIMKTKRGSAVYQRQNGRARFYPETIPLSLLCRGFKILFLPNTATFGNFTLATSSN